MRRKQYPLITILVFSLLALVGCGKQEARTGDETGSAESAANANRTTPAAAPVPSGALAPPPIPSGDYILSEVQHKGQVTMITAGNSTEISFRPDGTYARVSRLGGKVDHSDSGDFRIEDGKQIVLRIRMWKKKFQPRSVEKKHSFMLSSDGSELKMIGTDGKIGVFRRTRVLAAN